MARKPTITLEQIIEAALDHFLENGFEETTFNQIATTLNVTQPALYGYFDNKMDLLGGCCLWAAKKGRSFIDSNVNPRDPAIKRLSQYIRGNLEFFRKYRREAYAISAVFFFAQTHDKLKATFDQIHKTSLERFEAAVLQVSYERGKKLRNPKVLAELLHSLMVGEVYKVLHNPKHFKPQDRDNIITKVALSLFDSNWA